jgi:hypothetical protein
MVSRTISIVVGLVSLLIALISAFLVWFNVSVPSTSAGTISNSYSLIDTYRALFQITGTLTKGVSSLPSINTSPSGPFLLLIVLLLGAFSNYLIILFAGLTMITWPLMIIAGLVNAVRRRFGFLAGILGLVGFVSAMEMVSMLGPVLKSPPTTFVSFPAGGTITLGYGPWLLLASAILFLAAGVLGLASRRRSNMQRASIPEKPSLAHKVN